MTNHETKKPTVVQATEIWRNEDELSLVEAEAERAALALGGRSSAERLSPKPETP